MRHRRSSDPTAIESVWQIHFSAARRDDGVEAGGEGGGVVGAIVRHRAVVGDIESGGLRGQAGYQKEAVGERLGNPDKSGENSRPV